MAGDHGHRRGGGVSKPMTHVGIEIVGHEILGRRLRAIGRLAEVTVRRAIAESAMRIEREAKLSIRRNPRRGAAYVRHDPERRGRASAPGDAPATDTGALARSITHVIYEDGLGASVEARAKHAAWSATAARRSTPGCTASA